jgi:hypothetical protein
MSHPLGTAVEAAGEGFLPKVGPVKILLTATTNWPSAARLMIEFSKVGCVVSIVCPAYGHPAHKVQSAHNTYPYKPLSPIDSLADAIATAKPDIIIPCDDLGVRHLHQLHSSKRIRHVAEVDIPALIVRSLGPPDSYATVDSRYLLLKISREEGIRTPETAIIKDLADFERWQSAFPWVMKADGTTGGRGVRIVSTPEEARGYFFDLRRSIGFMRFIKRLTVDRNLILEKPWWNSFNRVRPVVVAQSFIRGSPANCAVVCWNGEVLAGLGCEAVATETSTGPATVVRLVENVEMMVAARKIARRLSLSGFFGLDFVIEEETGATYLIEMNPRCTPPCHLRLGFGRDMIGALFAQLMGKTLTVPVSVTEKNLIAYFPQALRYNGELLSSSYHDVPDDEPALIQELLRSQPDQKALNAIVNLLHRRFFFSERARLLE